MNTISGTEPKPGGLWLALLTTALVCAAAISSQSYWLDEGLTAYKAAQPTVGTWWASMRAEGSSDLQQPLYMLFAWAWEKLAGLNEYALRSGNCLWVLFGVGAMWRAFGGSTVRFGMLLAVLTSAFAWYYLSEARPYAMQLGCSLAVLSAIHRLGSGSDGAAARRWVWVLCLASVLLAASGMLAMFWLAAYLGAAMLSSPGNRLLKLLSQHRLVWALMALSLAPVAAYYLWTVAQGARASADAGTDVRNLIFIVYELLGLAGMGPGRLEIRAAGFSAFKTWLPLIGLYALAIAVLLVIGVRQLFRSMPRRVLCCWSFAFLGIAAFLLAVGFVVQFRVLGRHFTAGFPLVAFVLGTGLASLLQRPGTGARLAAVVFLCFSFASCLGVRLAARHARDDYRGAAAVAHQSMARGEPVWWNADPECAWVYGLRLGTAPGSSNLARLIIQNPAAGFETNHPRPRLVLASKPDIYDGTRALRQYLAREGYVVKSNLVAFTIWVPPPSTP